MVLVKYPIPLTLPKLVPVLVVTLEILTQGLFAKTVFTNCCGVNCVVLEIKAGCDCGVVKVVGVDQLENVLNKHTDFT